MINLKKHIAFTLLTIYSVILLQDIIPHYHHDEHIVFGFTESCCTNQDELSDNQLAEHISCSSITHENNCTCNLSQHPRQKQEGDHQDCKPHKVQLSKLFVFNLSFPSVFEQTVFITRIYFKKTDNPVIVNSDSFRLRGPPFII